MQVVRLVFLSAQSTLVGQVLAQTGAVSSSVIQKAQREAKAAGKKAVEYAWILDSSPEERQHGVTADIAISPPVKLPSVEQEMFFIDSPGMGESGACVSRSMSLGIRFGLL